jgi:hypothetical protein
LHSFNLAFLPKLDADLLADLGFQQKGQIVVQRRHRLPVDINEHVEFADPGLLERRARDDRPDDEPLLRRIRSDLVGESGVSEPLGSPKPEDAEVAVSGSTELTDADAATRGAGAICVLMPTT